MRAVNLLLERIGRWHGAEVSEPSRKISPLRPHDLGHTFAYRLAAETGKDAYELERRLGQGSRRYIQRCTNPPEDVAAGYAEGFRARRERPVEQRRIGANERPPVALLYNASLDCGR